MKTIQIRWTRYAGHCWRSKDELISDVLLWTPSYGRTKVGRPARTYIQQLCDNARCSLEDLPGAMDDREGWWERVREIRASSATWWWTISFNMVDSQWLSSSTFKIKWLGLCHKSNLKNTVMTWLCRCLGLMIGPADWSDQTLTACLRANVEYCRSCYHLLHRSQIAHLLESCPQTLWLSPHSQQMALLRIGVLLFD